MDWDFEEEILLTSLFYKGSSLSNTEIINSIHNLSEFLAYRANLHNFQTDEPFRNVSGIKMKLKNILYVDSYGAKGLSQCSELDKQVVRLYKTNRNEFDMQVNQIMAKYKIDESYNVYDKNEQEENKQKFRDWLINIKKSCITKRTLFLLCEVDEYVLDASLSKISIWEISKIEDFRQFTQSLFTDANFHDLNKANHNTYKISLEVYMDYLRYKFEHSDIVVCINKNEPPSIKKPDATELGAFFPQKHFSLFLDSLISDGILTFEQLKHYNVLRYLNNRNIYPVIERRELSREISQIIKQAENACYMSKELNTEQNKIMKQPSQINENQHTAELKHVDFSHPEFCMGCDPETCIIEGTSIYCKNWRDLLIALAEHFLSSNPKAKELYHKSVYTNGERPFLLKEKPHNGLAARQMSNGYWVYLNLGIKDLVVIIGKLCQFCGVSLKNVDITYIPKTTGGKIMVELEDDSARFAQPSVRNAFRSWLVEQNPKWSNGTVMIHYSDADYLVNNECGITLEEALTAEDGLQRAYDAIERHFINNPTLINRPSDSARGYLCSLRMLKEFLNEKHPELLIKESITAASAQIIPDPLIEVLAQNYSSGFRFDKAALLLLGAASGVEIDEHIQTALKRKMFRRDDGVYFLLDTVADASTRNDIVEFADAYLQEYGCFEIPEFYKLYEDKVIPKCIGSANDFESFYEQIGNNDVCCVAAPQIGNRIARFSNCNVWGTFKEVSVKIIATITDEFYGSVNEDDLHTKFCAFSTALLAKIIKNCASDELVRVEINDSICYQTFDALGLPDNFSVVLSETLERLSDIGLEPSQDVLHTAISLNLGVNFLAEFNLPDWEAYRRLIAVFYKAEPRREWKRNIFGEVTG